MRSFIIHHSLPLPLSDSLFFSSYLSLSLILSLSLLLCLFLILSLILYSLILSLILILSRSLILSLFLIRSLPLSLSHAPLCQPQSDRGWNSEMECQARSRDCGSTLICSLTEIRIGNTLKIQYACKIMHICGPLKKASSVR